MFDKKYAELHAYSAYCFHHGVCQPADMVRAACNNGLAAIALVDRDGLFAVQQMAQASQETGLPVIYGTQLRLAKQPHIDHDGTYLPILAIGEDGYSRLSHAISAYNLGCGKRTTPRHNLTDLANIANGHWVILTGNHNGPVLKPAYRRLLRHMATRQDFTRAVSVVTHLQHLFGTDNVVIENCLYGFSGEQWQTQFLTDLSHNTGAQLVVTSGAQCITADDQRVADVAAAIRMNTTLDKAAPYLPAHHAMLPDRKTVARLCQRFPDECATTVRIAKRCAFDFHDLTPQLPHADIPAGYTDDTWLRHRVHEEATRRYGTPRHNPAAWKQLHKELAVISKLGFSGYFLIVDDIVQFCHNSNILCQGRGSAANSAVCYALGITAVDAVRHKMMFERFLSDGRTTPPDIDIDIESGRREEVIQYVYNKYGRDRAALVGTVMTYRRRAALKDVTQALGYSAQEVNRHSDNLPDHVDDLARRLEDLPQHMGIHPGGMVLCRQPVTNLCPVSWASKENRSVLQWDKGDCARAGMVKFDLLGLGMLSALHTAFDSLAARNIVADNGQRLDLHNLPQEDPEVYRLLQRADTVGVFQVESRAQMNTLPRIHPEKFYDIVVEVALIRPGPIQGNAVNPYIKRRRGREKVTYVHPLLKNVLEKTLGVPLFQEQLMKIAVDVAGFDPSQADRLRKAMSSKRSHKAMTALYPQLMEGMARQGLTHDQATQVWKMLEGFAQFGFPESHAFSFAYIVYASAWLKVHYPADFYVALLANQPMGFYSPQSLISDARRRGVPVLRADVNTSRVAPHVDTTTTPEAIHLGLNSITQLPTSIARRIVDERDQHGPYTTIDNLMSRTTIKRNHIRYLAQAGALTSIEPQRPQAMWKATTATPHTTQLAFDFDTTSTIDLTDETPEQKTVRDIATTGISTDLYPTALIRHNYPNTTRACDIGQHINNRRIWVIGVITHRQRPRTANGVTFLSLEDESGLINVICHKQVWEKYRHTAYFARGIMIRGMVQYQDGASAVVAEYMEEINIAGAGRSRDFR